MKVKGRFDHFNIDVTNLFCVVILGLKNVNLNNLSL